jgi:hypothetical protein
MTFEPHPESTSTLHHHHRPWVVRHRFFIGLIVGIAIALSPFAAMKTYRFVKANAPNPAPTVVVRQFVQVPPGVTHEGEAVDDPVQVERAQDAGLRLRRDCAWGVPGSQPYKGEVDQALRAAQLPDDVVRELERRVRQGQVADQVIIANDGIRAVNSGRYFGDTIPAMAFGKTMCLNTRVNFRHGHVEYGDLYLARAADGTEYAIMVPYACGNVSVLGEEMERGNGFGNGHEVSEPPGWVSLAAGIAGVLWIRRAANRRRRDLAARE